MKSLARTIVARVRRGAECRTKGDGGAWRGISITFPCREDRTLAAMNEARSEGAGVPTRDEQTGGEGCDLTTQLRWALVESAFPSPLPTSVCRP